MCVCVLRLSRVLVIFRESLIERELKKELVKKRQGALHKYVDLKLEIEFEREIKRENLRIHTL